MIGVLCQVHTNDLQQDELKFAKSCDVPHWNVLQTCQLTPIDLTRWFIISSAPWIRLY